MIAICRVLMFLAIVCLAAEVDAVAPTDAELHTMRGWVKANFEPDANTIPLSFTYGNTPSWSLLANWRKAYSSQQAQTIGYASWIPFYGEGVHETDIYNLRSKMSSYVTLGYDMRTHQDLGVAKRLIKEWREIVSPNYVGDFYPLMPYSVAQDVWMAWQYDRPEVGEGIVQVFRRNESPYTSAKLILFGLDSDAYYSVSDLDCHTTQRISGRELTEQGLVVTIPSCPQAVILQYSKCPPTRHPGTD